MGRGDYHNLWCGGGASRPGGSALAALDRLLLKPREDGWVEAPGPLAGTGHDSPGAACRASYPGRDLT